MSVDAAFYFDLASPLAYLDAERMLHALPGPAEWRPVLARELPAGERWATWRCESALAMRAATYAKSIGRAVPFAQAAFRQAFAGGRDLGQLDNVLIAAAACEMHPTAVTRGAELRSVADQLAESTRRATQSNIKTIPAIVVGERVYEGERAIERAAEQMLADAATGAAR